MPNNKKIEQLRCIDTELGNYNDENNAWMIGSLILENSIATLVYVSQGLSVEQRCYHEDYYIDQIIEIEYESTAKNNYINPTFIRIIDDKYNWGYSK